jgi:hypothetical protein
MGVVEIGGESGEHRPVSSHADLVKDDRRIRAADTPPRGGMRYRARCVMLAELYLY